MSYNNDKADIGDRTTSGEEDEYVTLESGCSLREQAHEQEFDRVKSDLHKAAEWDASGKLPLNVSTESPFGAAETPASAQESSSTSAEAPSVVSSLSSLDALQAIREHVVADMIGHDHSFNSPLEWKAGSPLKVPLVYCDFTASSRPLSSIEEYLHQTCLPYYGNTHTNTSVTGSQSSAFVSEARQIIAEACNAKITGKASQDVVLFA